LDRRGIEAIIEGISKSSSLLMLSLSNIFNNSTYGGDNNVL